MFTLLFSHLQNGERVPLIIDGVEKQMPVEASSKTEAIYKPEVAEFCQQQGNDCRIRRVI